MRRYGWISLLVFLFALVAPSPAEDSAGMLARILANKGVIGASELVMVQAADPEKRVQLLASILEEKGVLSRAEVAKLMPLPDASDSTVAAQLIPAVYKPDAAPQAPSAAQPTPQPSATPAPPVTAQSRFPVVIYGTILTNAFYNTVLTNITDTPLFTVQRGADAFGNEKNIGVTARQSRFGMRYQGPRVAGAQISGQFEFDLFGGKAPFTNGINFDLFRLRLAFGRLDWENISLVVGQDWSVFAPLNPTTFAEYAIPGLSASGNPWIRVPQIRADFRHAFSDRTRGQLQIGMVDPDVGDYSTAVFSATRTPGVGERGGLPGAQARLGLTTKVDDRNFDIGLSATYARGKNVGTVGTTNFQNGVDSWGVALDYSLPILNKFNLTGEAYVGRALGIFSVDSGESVLPFGTVGARGVNSRGGWMQAQFNLNPIWQINLAYGIDAPDFSQLPPGNRTKNQSYVGNVMYKFSPNVTFAWEYRRVLTNFRDRPAANNKDDIVNLAIAYIF